MSRGAWWLWSTGSQKSNSTAGACTQKDNTRERLLSCLRFQLMPYKTSPFSPFFQRKNDKQGDKAIRDGMAKRE